MRFILTIFLFCQSLLSIAIDLKYDPTQKWVTDPLNYLTPTERNEINAKLIQYEKKTGNEVAVVFQDNWEGKATIEDYATDLFHTWGIGKKGVNNGVLVVVSPGHRKWRIEVGYGLEGDLTDLEAKRIGESSFKPYFKEGKWKLGLDSGLDQILAKLGNQTPEQKAKQVQALLEIKKKKEAESAQFWDMVLFFLVVGLLLTGLGFGVWYLIERFRQRKRAEEEAKQRKLEEIRRYKEYEDSLHQEYIGYLNKIKETNDTALKLKSNWQDCLNFNKLFSDLKDAQFIDSLSNEQKEREIYDLRSICRNNQYIVESMVEIQHNIEKSKITREKINHTLSLLKIQYRIFKDELVKFNQKYPEYFTPSQDPETLFLEWESLIKMLDPIYIKLPKVSTNEWQKILNTSYDLESAMEGLGKYFDSLTRLRNDLEGAEKVLSQIDTNKIKELMVAADLASKKEHVTNKTRQEFLTLQQRFENSDFNISNIIKKASLLHYYFQSFQSIDKMSNQDIKNHFEEIERKKRELIAKLEREKREKEEAERRKRRREEEEEEDRRRRNSYSSSSYDSYSSSWSSSDSGSSFGGGDSGGGGASGDF